MRSKSRRGYKAAHCSLFISTPQSRLAPCQLPVRGAFLVWCKLKPKAVPAGGESGHERSEWPKGERLGDTKCRDMFPFRHGLRRDTFPVNGDGLNCSTSMACSAVPLRGAIVSIPITPPPYTPARASVRFSLSRRQHRLKARAQDSARQAPSCIHAHRISSARFGLSSHLCL